MLTVSLFSIYNYLLRELLLTFHSRNIEMLGKLSRIRLPRPWDSPGKNTGVSCHLKVKLLSRVQLLATPWTAAFQAPPSMGFSGQEYEWGAIAFSKLEVLQVPKGTPECLEKEAHGRRQVSQA